MIRTLLALAAAAGGLLVLLPSADSGMSPATIRTEPVRLSPVDPAVTRTGALCFLEGWALHSRDRRFGGLSSIAVHGDRVLGVSDAGTSFWFRLRPGGEIDDAWIGGLPDGPGSAGNKKDRDSESLALDPATGQSWVGFERRNEIWRYDPRRTRAEAHAAPLAMRKWPANSGPEALVRMADGRFLIFSEGAPGPDNSRAALLFASDPAEPGARPVRFGYRAPAGYRVTDATQLPDGRLLMLHRRFSVMDGFSAIVSILDPEEIKAGRAVEGTEIARLSPPLTVDNLEAIAVSQENGRTIVWLASDDNFYPIQRTLLMRFVLDLGDRQLSAPPGRHFNGAAHRPGSAADNTG